jgi:hypothetical protein
LALTEVIVMQSRGIVRGKIIELEEVLPYAEGSLVNVIIEPEETALQAGSSAAIRQVMHEPPHLAPEDIEELEQAIKVGHLPVHDGNVFDDGR